MSVQWTPVPFRFVKPGEVFAVGLVFPLVCAVLVGARLYVRRFQKQPLGIDGWTAIISTVFLFGMGASLITGERLGIMGYPMPVPSGTMASEAYGLFNTAYITEAKIEFAFQFLQCFQFACVKSSVVFFFRRIFISHKGTAWDWASKVLLVIINLWSVSFLMALIFGCGKNVALHWAPLEVIGASGCDTSTPEKANLYSDPILDFLILILPLPSIWNLSMSTSRKLAVTGIFLVGIMTLAASATRLAIHITILNMGYGAGYDINQVVTTIFYWSMVESGLANIAANLPSLSILFRERNIWVKLSRGRSWSDLLKSFTSGKQGASSGQSWGSGKEPGKSLDSGSFHPLAPLPPRTGGTRGEGSQTHLVYYQDNQEVAEPMPARLKGSMV